jgi:hypothetical protein
MPIAAFAETTREDARVQGERGPREEMGMKRWMTVLAILVAATMLWSGAALGQATPKQGCEAMKAGAPQRIEGQVVRVDPNQAKLTIKANDGTTHEFQASQEMIRDFKVGDRIEAQLRGAANC